MTGSHENWGPAESVTRSSDRTFGLVFTVFFALVAFLPLLRHHQVRVWAVVLSGAFCVIALAAPKILAPLNRIWTALGALLHTVTNPIILGAFFFLAITPMGWLMRRLGKDSLRLTRSPEAESYWIVRQPPGPEPESMSNQY